MNSFLDCFKHPLKSFNISHLLFSYLTTYIHTTVHYLDPSFLLNVCEQYLELFESKCTLNAETFHEY